NPNALLADTTGGVAPTPEIFVTPTAIASEPTGEPAPPSTNPTTPSSEPVVIPAASSVNTDLTQDQLDVMVAAALHRWELSGLTAEQIAVLEQATFTVSAALPGAYLGAESTGHVDISV